MDPKKLVFEHGEKIGLGLAVLILLVYLLMAFAVGGANTDQADINALADQVRQLLQNNKPPNFDELVFLRRARDPWEQVTKAGDANDWSMYYPTKIVEIRLDPERPAVDPNEKKPTVNKAPNVSAPAVDIGAITVKWKRDAGTTAPIDHYLVHRKMEGGEFKEVAKVAGEKPGAEGEAAEGEVAAVEAEEIAYVDSDVQPKKTYVYKVESVTTDALASPKKASSGEVNATATSTVSVALKGGSATSKIANVSVRKFFAETKAWDEATFVVTPGKMIGEKKTRRVGSKPVVVDFTSGFTLLDLKEDQREKKRMVKKTKIKDGQPVETEEEETYKETVLKMTIKDEEGKTIEQWTEPAKVGGATPPGK